jgi:pyridoxine 5-phosphate synthase
LREARREKEPDLIEAARLCEEAGCDSIVCHLREDRRHIKDGDVRILRRVLDVRFNLEMSISKEIVDIACAVKPEQATLVPERRQEITTEGGIDVVRFEKRIKDVVRRLTHNGIDTSLFIDPVKEQIDAACRTGAGIIELHTGSYANAKSGAAEKQELSVLKSSAKYAIGMGLEVNAGHGLNYANCAKVAAIDGINELNIGHSIISRAIFVGLEKAVKEMRRLIR